MTQPTAEAIVIEWGIRVLVPHPARREKIGDVIKLVGPDAEMKARRCTEIWHGWSPVQRKIRRAGPWTSPPPAAPDLHREKGS